MGAKALLLMTAAFAVTGCAGALQRVAPPGIVKYEELAGDEPVDPAIAKRIEARREEGGGGFPALAEQPTKTPEGIAKPERAAMEEALVADRDALQKAVAADREEAAAVRADAIEAGFDAPTHDNNDRDADQ